MLRYLPILLILGLWIYAFIDCLNTPEEEIRKLPKVVWVIIILLFGQVLLGPIAWLWVGRPRKHAPYGATKPDERRWVAPDDNPDFLRSLRDESQDRPVSDPRDADTPEETDARPAATADDAPAADGAAEERSAPPEDEKLFQEWEADLGRDEIRDKDGDNGNKGGGPDDTSSPT